MAAAVARGGEVEWWGRGIFEAVVAYHRYLPGRRWGYVFPLLFIGPFIIGSASNGFGDELKRSVGSVDLVLWAVGIVAWVGRTRYERSTVDEDGGVKVAGVGLVASAAAVTLVAGLAGTIPGGAHLLGVIGNATSGVYPSYDFRLASLLILGMGMVFAGVLCLTAVRGLYDGQRRAWDRAVIGAFLLFLVTLPITPHPTQGGMAGFLSFFAAVDLLVLLAMRVIPLMAGRRRLEAG